MRGYLLRDPEPALLQRILADTLDDGRQRDVAAASTAAARLRTPPGEVRHRVPESLGFPHGGVGAFVDVAPGERVVRLLREHLAPLRDLLSLRHARRPHRPLAFGGLGVLRVLTLRHLLRGEDPTRRLVAHGCDGVSTRRLVAQAFDPSLCRRAFLVRLLHDRRGVHQARHGAVRHGLAGGEHRRRRRRDFG